MIQVDEYHISTSLTIYARLLRVFSDPSPMYLVVLLCIAFVKPIKEGPSLSPVASLKNMLNLM